jgi:general secretion pathway protein I
LLEAIVALVLLSSTGLALFSWINTNLISLQRVAEIQRHDRLTRSALEFMETVNPMTQPRGENRLGPYTIRWDARPVLPPRDGIGYPGGVSLFQVGLYDTDVDIAPAEGQGHVQFTLRQVGYRQVREPSLEP